MGNFVAVALLCGKKKSLQSVEKNLSPPGEPRVILFHLAEPVPPVPGVQPAYPQPALELVVVAQQLHLARWEVAGRLLHARGGGPLEVAVVVVVDPAAPLPVGGRLAPQLAGAALEKSTRK